MVSFTLLNRYRSGQKMPSLPRLQNTVSIGIKAYPIAAVLVRVVPAKVILESIPFIFWNLNGRPLQKLVASIAKKSNARLIILAECDIDPSLMIAELSGAGLPDFIFPYTPSGSVSDIRIFSRLTDGIVVPISDDPNNHVTIRRLAFGKGNDVLLVALHSQSKRSWSDEDQAQGATRLARKISAIEHRFGHSRTLLVGDLNMNPFEKGVVGSEGLHAVMTKKIASEGSRIVDAEERAFFYNPMWRFFGERPDGPPGTYYYPSSGKPIAYYWHMYDQVMVRPNLISYLVDVKILVETDGARLVDDEGIPSVIVASDHLPLLFTLRVPLSGSEQ
jgi:hypothetical protein